MDAPVLGLRERDIRNAFVPMAATAVASGRAGAGGRPTLDLHELAELFDQALTWSDLEHFSARTDLPVLVKGVRTPGGRWSAGRPA